MWQRIRSIHCESVYGGMGGGDEEGEVGSLRNKRGEKWTT